MSLDQDLKDKQQIRDQLGPHDKDFPVFKFITETDIIPEELATRINRIGVAGMIWGSDTFGVWNVSQWTDSDNDPFILGSSTFGVLGEDTLGGSFGETVLEAVINPFNRFKEWFRNDTFTDNAQTTATLNTTTFKIEF